MESSLPFGNTDSWGEDNSVYPSNHGSSASAASLGSTKLRLMCSNGGHIVPRPHDKSLCYVGGETRMVVVDRNTTLLDLTHRLSKTLLRSSSSSSAKAACSFTLKYQLPSEDLDSLISVTTDEDLENMIEEYERLNSSSRLRLFIFPMNPASLSSIGSFLENSTKSEDWFLNALNGTNSGFSDTSSVNGLLGLDDEISLPEKKDDNHKGAIGTNLRGNNPGQDVHSIPDSPMMETTSSFGSASSTPSLANLPLIRVNADDHPKVIGGGIDEQFSQMSVQQRHHKHQDDVGFVASPAPVVLSGSPTTSATAIPELSDPFLSYHNSSEQGLQMTYLKHHQQHQQQQFQQKESTGLDLASADSVWSNHTITDQLSPVAQNQCYSNNNPNDAPDQNTRIQIQQQQQIQNSAYLLSMPTTQIDSPRHQLHHQQLQFIPPPQYIHHHPSMAVPVPSYYHNHPHHPPMDQQNFVYYIPSRQPSHGYNFPLQQPQPSHVDPPPATDTPNNQAALKPELQAGVYRTTNSGAPQLLRVPSGHQNQPQYVGYSEIHQPSQPIYYATQAMPPLTAAQYQKMTSTSPVEASLQEQQP